ncbi:MAG TPA: sugar phosphate nucleotidyltransferase [Candidatus Limnocylindrales bacterium]|nr:sugar phosphate nucleotidyltransferase [Candidatus Limnocylindrales bacterium]
MHAVILAGGRGTRLRPYTTTLPKPLVPIGDEFSILEIVLRQLARRGFERATIAIGYLGALIRAYVGDGSQWRIAVDYVTEDVPLGTMGPVVLNLDRFPEHFLVMNGDILTDLDFADLLRGHAAGRAPLTIGTYRRDVKIDYGVLEVERDRIVGFHEKPVLDYSVSRGVYGLSRTTLERYEAGRPLGFDQLVLDLLARGEHPASYSFSGHWLDIGRPEDYDRANSDIDLIRPTFLPEA